MTTFLATHPHRIGPATGARLDELVRASRFSISLGDPDRNQPAVTLCFNGPREQANESVISEFHRIISEGDATC